MASDIGGVWRTISGRRVFIKEGQSLSEAMKESGKFKKSNKKDEEYELYKKAKENPDSIDPMTENSTDWEALEEKYGKRYNKETYDKYVKEKLNDDDYLQANRPNEYFQKQLRESGVKTFADEIKEMSKKDKILSNKELSNMSWEEVIQKNTEYYSSKSIYDFEGGKQGKYKYEDGWRDNGGAGVIKQSDLDKLITKEEWLKARKK